MKKILSIIFCCCVTLFVSQTANAQLGKFLDKAKSITDKVKETTNTSGTSSSIGSGSVTKAVEKSTERISIFFAPSKFKNGTEGAKTQFKEGEHIYARLILPKPVKEYLSKNGDLFLNIGSRNQYAAGNGDGYAGMDVQINGNTIDKEATQLDVDVLPAVADASTHFKEYLQLPAQMGADCSTAKNNEKIEFVLELNDLKGYFSIEVANSKTFAAFIKPTIEKVKSFQDDDDAMQEEVRPEFSEKSYTFNDPQINKQRIIATLPDNTQMLKMVIGPGEDYVVIKNDFGAILRKQSIRYIYVLYKEKTSGYCYSVNVIFERDYEGNGKYGNLTNHNHGGRIDCSKIK